jgi:zinc/manganese transport system substrate-binding protein
MKIKYIAIPVMLILSLASHGAQAKLNVFACEPEWGALVKELGGEQVDVYTATTALQDPHHIQARPSLIAKARRADLLVCNGGGLEIGWLPVLLRSAGNGRIQQGQPGYFMATEQVELLEKPQVIDRAMGDIHAEGNPHIVTDPNMILRVANALTPVLARLDAAHARDYQARHRAFSQRWQQAVLKWEQQAAPLKGVRVVVQHDSWVYLFHWLGIRQVAVMEPVAGISPSTAHLASLVSGLKANPARMVIRAAYQEPRPSRWLGEHLDIPVVELPFSVGGVAGADDLYGLYQVTIDRLLGARK